jgi:hypothetical protein
MVIVEVGCGHGRLGFHVVRHLLAMRAEWPASWDAAARAGRKPFLYVMADLAEQNIRFIERFSPLRTMIEAGWLDTVLFGEQLPTIERGFSSQASAVCRMAVPPAAIASV